MSFRQTLLANRQSVAYVIGNGINRYRTNGSTNSWWALLRKIAAKRLGDDFKTVPKGLSLTEFYDLLDLTRHDPHGDQLQRDFGDELMHWQPQPHHEWVMEWIAAWRRPVLTTNFDFNLNNSLDAQLYHLDGRRMTDYYPWESYFGFTEIDDPTSEFGIWHVNGTCMYTRSIRLGLTHYMGSVERARSWIHRGNENKLFSGKDVRNWRGAKSWLQILFNCDLLILGLALEQNEVFLRWLLIERAKYFRKFPERAKAGWYVETKDSHDAGKSYFLNGVGIKTIQVQSYDAIWDQKLWT